MHNYYLRDNNKLHNLHRLFDNRLFHKLMLFTLLLVEGIYGTANKLYFLVTYHDSIKKLPVE